MNKLLSNAFLNLCAVMLFSSIAHAQLLQDYKNSHKLDLPNQYKQVDEYLLRGPRPREVTQDVNDYQFLKELHVDVIVDLEQMPWHIEPEWVTAKKYGFTYVQAYIQGSPFRPWQSQVKKAVNALLKDTRQGKKSFVHCALGRDRTSLIVALYEIQEREKSPQDAWNEMVEDGYNPNREVLVGLKNYFHQLYPDVDQNAVQPPSETAEE